MLNIPAIQTNAQNDFNNYNPNINNDLNNNNNSNNIPHPYYNSVPTGDYPPSDLYGSADPRMQMNTYSNYGNEMNMGMNMAANYNNMDTGAYNKDNYTPKTRDRLRMAGNNILK